MTDNTLNEETVKRDRECLEKILSNIERVIIGKKKVVEMTLLTMIAEGHILIEDVPGVGKTSLVVALAKSVDCMYQPVERQGGA